MRVISFAAATVIILAGCQREAATPPPGARETVSQVTTTAPPSIEGKQEFAIAFTQPDLLASFVVGTSSADGTRKSNVAKKGDSIAFDVTVKEVPAGLAATVEVFSEKEIKVYSERKLVPQSKVVSLAWSDSEKKAGEYKVRLFLGGDQYAEQRLTISE